MARATTGTVGVQPSVEMAPLSTEEALASEVYARATEELTDRFVHELRPLVGMARVHASREIENFESSDTASALAQIQDLLRGFDTLGRAAASPRLVERELASFIREVVAHCQAELADSGLQMTPPALEGPDPLLIVTDPDLLGFALRNGLRNAFEASKGTSEPIVVTWGQSQTEYWIAVLDYGDGLPADQSALFTIGTTNKERHLGLGLAIADRAMATLGGTVSLESQPNGSTRFELKCPRVVP
jgi:signal transduction histidine kinase